MPRGFQRIRHYELLANRQKAENLAKAWAALDVTAPEPVESESVEAFALRVLGVDIRLCPVCAGRLRMVRELPRQRGPPDHA